MKDSHLSRGAPDREMQLVRAFFGEIKGYFVEVGANEPRERSQTWLLDEQSGWIGLLIEPYRTLLPACGLGAKQKSFRSRVPPPRTPDANCRFTLQGRYLPLNRERMAPGATPESVINVSTRTLDSILIEAGTASGFDFLSIDNRSPARLRCRPLAADA